MWSVYNPDGTKRTEWPSKSSAIAAAKALGIVGLYVANEGNAEIVYTVKPRGAFKAYSTARYTFTSNNDSFHTATIYKDGERHMIMAEVDANEYCQKWNGTKGDFERKA